MTHGRERGVGGNPLGVQPGPDRFDLPVALGALRLVKVVESQGLPQPDDLLGTVVAGPCPQRRVLGGVPSACAVWRRPAPASVGGACWASLMPRTAALAEWPAWS